MKRRWWGLGLRGLACLGAGVVVTVLVAWGCAVWSWPPQRDVYLGDMTVVEARPSALLLDWTPPEWLRLSAEEKRAGWLLIASEFRTDSWGTRTESLRIHHDHVAGYPLPEAEVHIVRTGWPSLSMQCVTRWHLSDKQTGGPASSAWFCGIDIPARLLGPAPMMFITTTQPRAIPLRPVWPGFAVDAAFYGGCVYAAFASAGRLRTASRRRRGLCVRCRYDLRGLGGRVCPECGHERETTPDVRGIRDRDDLRGCVGVQVSA